MSVYVKRYGKVLAVVVLALVMGLLVVLSVTRQSVRGEESPEVNLAGRLTEKKHQPKINFRVVTEVAGARDYNHRVWRVEKELEVVDPVSGKLKLEKRIFKIVEVGCGICYQDADGDWQVAKPVWRATRDGFVMDRADYRLQIGATLSDWLNYTVDDVTMQMRPARLQVVRGDYQVDIARINPLVAGVIDGDDPSRLIFVNAFGPGIDLELQAQRDGFHQNVIFKRKPILLERLDTADALVRIYTELNLDNCVDNQDVGVIIEGQEIEDFEQLNTAPTREDIEFVKVWSEGEVLVASDRHRFGRSKVFDAGDSTNRRNVTAYKQLYRDKDDKTYLVETLVNSFFQEAQYPVTWDYVTRNGAIEEDEDWYADATYYVNSDITLTNGAKLRIEPGTIVKLDGAEIDACDGELVAQGKPYEYIVFTSKNDNYYGESISGSSGSPVTSDWDRIYIDESSIVEHCKMAYASVGIHLSGGATSEPIRHNIIADCNDAIFIDSDAGTHRIFNNLITDCTNGINIYNIDGNVELINNTIDNCTKGILMQDNGASGDIVKNNLITNCTDGIDGTSWSDITHNGYHSCTGGKLGTSKVELTNSPYDASNVYLGSHFLDATNGASLINAGTGQVGTYYDTPGDWSIYHVSGTGRLFTDPDTVLGDTTWQPDTSTDDEGTVAIGYHHPRVDYVLYHNVIVPTTKTLTIDPGTVVAMQGFDDSNIVGDLVVYEGTLICEGDLLDGGYVQLVLRTLASTNFEYASPRYGGWPGLWIYSGANSKLSFTKIIGLSGTYIDCSITNPIHDNIFKSNCYGLVTYGGDISIENNLFMENYVGWATGSTASGTHDITNCTFDRSGYSSAYLDINSGLSVDIKNCAFTNNALDGNGSPSWLAILRYSSEEDPGTFIESYNAFYNNQYHYYDSDSGLSALDATDYAGEPNASSSGKILDEDDFYQGWSDFADRFYLPSGSKLIDAGDPNAQNTAGYTTDCSSGGSADTGTIDIGYRYPSDHDTDDDGIIDFAEAKNGTKQDDYDTDDDGLVDGGGGLISTATYADGYDVDGDGYVDGEADLNTDPNDDDSDDDDMPDGWEHGYGLNPLSDSDASGDADSDELSNLLEYQLGLDPRNVDSDDDGMPDGWEYSHALTPDTDDASDDYDGDGYSNIVEYVHGSLPEVYNNPGDPNDVLVPTKIYVPSGVISIQAAITGSLAGDEIVVFPGTYYENIDLLGKDVTLRSMAPENGSVVAATVINGGGNDVVVFENSEGNDCHLDGFTITAGADGISCSGSEPKITNCRIIDNADCGLRISGGAAILVSGCEISGNQLGAVRIESASAELEDCFVHDNRAVQGGGVAVSGDSSIEISSCVFEQNLSTGNGGGIYISNPAGALIANSTFKDNQAQLNGGGLYNLNSSVVLERCSLVANEAVHGAGLFNNNGYALLSSTVIYGNLAEGEGGGIYNDLSDPNLINCTVIKNQAVKGGAVANHDSLPRIINSILWHNLASEVGSEIYNQGGGQAWLRYCDIEDCGVSELGQWDSSLGVNGGYNLEIEPAFVDMGKPAGKDGIFGNRDDGLYLCCRKDSSESVGGGLLDRADGNYAPAFDRVGKRAVDVPYLADLGTGPCSYVDIGAYESPAIWYVNQYGSIANEGDCWDNAFAYLQDALEKADDITSDFDPNDFDPTSNYAREIWVSKGTYYPYNKFATYLAGKQPCEVSLEMVGGVDIYGGFAGGETAVHERNWVANQTILSGEINYHKPSYHVVRGANHARLDGFVVTGGQAFKTGTDNAKGAGMLNDVVCLTVANCVFKDNQAHYGAGMYNRAERVEITASVFEDNLATYSGGGVYNSNYQDPNTGQYRNGNCMIKEAVFKNNQAVSEAGGGLYNEKCNLDICESEFRDNMALKGGAIANSRAKLSAADIKFIGNSHDKYHDSSIHYGGAVYNEYAPLVTFNRCVFQENSAGQYSYIYNDPERGSWERTSCGYGGALYDKGDLQNYPGSTILANCVLLDNTGGSGGAIYHYGPHSRVAAVNCTFYGNTANGQGTHLFYNPVINYYGGEGGALCNNNAETELINCILWDNPATTDPNEIFNRDGSGSSDTLVSNSIVKDCFNGLQWDNRLGTTLGGNLNESPLFNQADDPNGPDGWAGTRDDGIRLQGASCGIDEGSLDFLDDPNFTVLLKTDILAGPRIQYGGQKNQIDIGAYEFRGITAMDQHLEINEDPAAPVAITLEAIDIHQQELVFSITDGPRHGKLEVNGNGPGCWYLPDPNYNGKDSFGFEASSGINSDCAAVTITIRSQDDPPCPDDDTISMKQADSIQFNVLANDYHPDGKSFSLISYDDSHTSSFITAVYSDGMIDFEPAQEYYNTPDDPYQFSYVVQDANSNISAAGVSVRVHAAPLAGADSLVTWRNLLLIANVFENDNDPDHDALAISGWTLPGHGALAYHGNGGFTYLPNDNYTGTDDFEYILQDPAGNIDTATVTINVIHAPDDPNTIDTDMDGLSDILEMEFYGSDPNCADTDMDGLVDSWEAHYNQNVDILIWDYEGADPDDDGLSNIEEAGYGTNPNRADTDGDGMSDFAEVELGYDPLVAQSDQQRYYPGKLPYHCSFEDFYAGNWNNSVSVDFQQGWQEVSGVGNVEAYRSFYLHLEPNSVVRKGLIDTGTNHRYIKFTVGSLGPDVCRYSEIKILNDQDIVAAIKFGIPEDPDMLYVFNGTAYQSTDLPWNDIERWWTEVRFEMDFAQHSYNLYWNPMDPYSDPFETQEPNMVFADVAFGKTCSTLDAVEFEAKEHSLWVNNISISDYNPALGISVNIDSPCHCDGPISKSRVPVIGELQWDRVGFYKLCFRPVDLWQEDMTAGWHGFELGAQQVTPGGILGYWDTGLVPNGYYYLGIVVIDETFSKSKLYALHEGNNWSAYSAESKLAPVAVMGDLKGNTFFHAEQPDISVAWPGEFPFEFQMIYNRNRLFRPSPFASGWTHNHNITLVEDARYYWDSQDFMGAPYTDDYLMGFGDIWVTYPDGSRQLYKHTTGQSDNRYYPYPENHTGEYIDRRSYADGGSSIIFVEYVLKQRNGTTMLFSADVNYDPENYMSMGGMIGWRHRAYLDSRSDRFGNTLEYQWEKDDSCPLVKNVSYNNLKLEFHTNISDHYDRIELKTDSRVYRTVRFEWYDVNEGMGLPFMAYKIYHTGSGVDADGILQDSITTNQKHYIYGAGMFGIRWIFYDDHVRGNDCNIYVNFDKWGRVSHRKDLVEEDLYHGTKFVYDLYHPDLPNNPLMASETPGVNSETVSYLKAARYNFLNPTNGSLSYRSTCSWQSDKGSLLVQDNYAADWSYSADVDYEYANQSYPLKPTHITEAIEGTDGQVRHRSNVYNSAGDLIEQQIYDGQNTANRVCLEIEYHPDLPVPIRQITWQGPGKTGQSVEKVFVYGDPDGVVDEHGKYLIQEKVLLECDPNVWAITSYKYKSSGEILEQIDPSGNRVAYEYDPNNGYPTCMKAGPAGNEVVVSRLRYDAIGQLLLQADQFGKVTRNHYDDLGRMYKVQTYSDPAALLIDYVDFTLSRYYSFDPNSVTCYGYDSRNNLVYEEKPNGGLVRTEHTRNNQQKTITCYDDRDGDQQPEAISREVFEYDARGKVVKTTKIDLHDPVIQHSSEVINEYDFLDRLLGTWWRGYDGETILKCQLYDYDGAGRKIRQQLGGSDTGLKDNGDIPLLRCTEYEYNVFDKLTRRKVWAGPDEYSVTRFEYDLAGNRTAIIDPAGSIIYTDYDNANRKEAEYFAIEYHASDPNVSRTNARLSRKLTYHQNSALATETSYDNDGSVVLSYGEFNYDSRGRLHQVTRHLTEPGAAEPNVAVTRYNYYDPNASVSNHQVVITDTVGKETRRIYDTFGNIIKIIYPSGDYQQQKFNADGSLQKQAVFDDTGKKWIHYEYDGFGRLTKTIYPDSGWVAAQYDGFGRRTRLIDQRQEQYHLGGSNQINYEYSPLGDIVVVTDPNDYQTRYSYRGDGQRNSLLVKDPAGQTVYSLYYFYDLQGRLYYLRRLKDDQGTNLAIFDYDANGNRKQLWHPLTGQQNGPNLWIDYTYNRDNRLIGIQTDHYQLTGDPNYQLTNVTLDGLGRLLSADETVTDTSGTRINHSLTNSYDRLGQLTAAGISNIAGANWSADYNYDKAGNLLNCRKNSSASQRSYNGDLLTGSSGSDNFSLDWDDNGNLTTGISEIRSYDWENRLSQVQIGSETIDFRYDPDGNRVLKSTSAGPDRRYLVDIASDLPVILLAFNTASDEITKSYVHDYDRPLAQYAGPMSSGAKFFYLCSRLGSVRQLIDVNGSVKHLYTYGPFGKKLESDSDPDDLPNPFQFTGQYFDTETGDYHLRARTYSPALQRFTSRDPYLGQLEEPATLHAYLYCLNNPINRIDPFGEYSLLEQESTSAIQTGMHAYGAYSTAQSIKGYAQQLKNGIALQSIFKDIAINAAMGYAGGKLLGAAIKGIGRASRRILNKRNMKIVRRLGKEGEDAAGIARNTKRIKSYTGAKKYRIPDGLDHNAGILTEVKNRANLSFDAQLMDYLLYCEDKGYKFILKTRRSTRISGPLQKAIDAGQIVQEFID